MKFVKVSKGDCIKKYLKVIEAGSGDYSVTIGCDGEISDAGQTFVFCPDREAFEKGDCLISIKGQPICIGWSWASPICERFSDGELMSGFNFNEELRKAVESQQ